MAVVRRTIGGKKMWVIDRRFYRPGHEERHRRAAKIQNRAAAEAEERELIATWTKYGTLKPEKLEPVTPAPRPKVEPRGKAKTWEDAVKHYMAVVAPTKKPSTRRGYEHALKGPHLAWWNGQKLSAITTTEIIKWGASLAKLKLSPATQRNQHIVLRAVLNAAVPTLLSETPKYPSLPKVGRTAVVAATQEDVDLIINEKDPDGTSKLRCRQRDAARLAFAIAAYAGLRAGEVRGLRVRDVDLKRGIITVRTAITAGEESTPKSGHQREVPITAALRAHLEPRLKHLGKNREAFVAMKAIKDGEEPWGEFGFIQALKRSCKRLGLDQGKYHGLRHYFATSLFASGKVDARTVQGLLGHSSLEVTQRYAHHSMDRARAAVEAVWG